EHFVMCSAGYRMTLAPAAFVRHAFAASEGDPRGSVSLEELTTALAHLEARGLLSRLMEETLREEARRQRTSVTPEVWDSHQVGDVDFTPRGCEVHRSVIRAIHGDAFLARSDSGFNLDVSAGRFDVYAVTLDDCRSLMHEIESGGDSYTGEEHTRFVGREEPTAIGHWKPNRFVRRETGYHGVLYFVNDESRFASS
ncbi:MAG: hypothetical protein K0S86_4559, partial [Geminicoccaceae bacterium]|nr:hypothetical protein [Geminicoccaceae bacterium]